MSFIKILESRHSEYDLSKDVKINNAALQASIENVLKYTPSAFNSQSQRILMLLGDQHDALWSYLIGKMRVILDKDQFVKTEEKLSGFKNAYGTIVFFEDMEVIENLQSRFPLYKDNFSRWSIEQNGMLQSNVWLELSELGLGASLQHYNELIDGYLKDTFDLSLKWLLAAQMPFGEIMNKAVEKPHEDICKRFILKK